jgi:hypothetical protein
VLVILIVTTYLLIRYRETWWTPRQEVLSTGPLDQERKKAVNDEEGYKV